LGRKILIFGPKTPVFCLTHGPFLPRNRLLAGRFSARVAFRDPWFAPSFRG
jgi:hypothetical protein